MFMGLKTSLMGHINHIMGFKTRHNVVKVPNEPHWIIVKCWIKVKKGDIHGGIVVAEGMWMDKSHLIDGLQLEGRTTCSIAPLLSMHCKEKVKHGF